MCQQLSALLHPREQVRILSAPEEAQRTLFTRLWCRKEAYLKGLGVGLAHDSTEGYISSLERTPGWHVTNIDAPAGFAGAVATAAAIPNRSAARRRPPRPAHRPRAPGGVLGRRDPKRLPEAVHGGRGSG